MAGKPDEGLAVLASTVENPGALLRCGNTIVVVVVGSLVVVHYDVLVAPARVDHDYLTVDCE